MRAASLRLIVALVLSLPGSVWAQSAAVDGEFIYHARIHDTLIGIGRRLLLEPRRWREVQVRNQIADPRRIPPGSQIRIPYAWLRMSPEAATITAISGKVRQGARTLGSGAILAEGSQLETGPDGSVSLTLADGSVITLQKSSVLTLQEMRRVTGAPATHDTRLKLDSGRLQTVVKPQGNEGRFEIVTPVAISAVRGTQFRSAFEPGTADATTETLEGLVGVSGITAVAVPADFGTRVRRSTAPLPPRRLLLPPNLQPLAGTNGASRLHLQWSAVPGASGYRVQLASDAEFRSFLIDATTATSQVDLPAPTDGSYWLRVRSIDGFGLEGRDTVRQLVQHLLPAAPVLVAPAPATSVFGDAAILAWNSLGPGIRYRVQIAHNADFTDLLLEREAGEATHIDITPVPPGRYFWRLAGFNDRGESGDWSPPQEYVQRQSAPTPYPPTFVAHRMQLHWDPQDRIRYRVQIAHDSVFNDPVLDQILDLPQLSLPRPRPGIYYARIQTIAEDGSTAPFGTVMRFEVPVRHWLAILLPLLTLLTLIR